MNMSLLAWLHQLVLTVLPPTGTYRTATNCNLPYCHQLGTILLAILAGTAVASLLSNIRHDRRETTIAPWEQQQVREFLKGPSTLATLFSHRWPRFCGGPEHTRATCGGDSKVSYPPAKFPYSAKFPTLLSGCHMPHEQSLACSLPNAERSHKNALSVAGTSHSLWHTWATNCSVLAKAWKYWFPTGINIPATKKRPPVAKQSGQRARALTVDYIDYLTTRDPLRQIKTKFWIASK